MLWLVARELGNIMDFVVCMSNPIGASTMHQCLPTMQWRDFHVLILFGGVAAQIIVYHFLQLYHVSFTKQQHSACQQSQQFDGQLKVW